MSNPEEKPYHGDNRKWHLGKVVDAPLLIALLLQTGGVVWYGAQIVKTVEYQGSQISAMDLKVNELVKAQGGNVAQLLRLQILESEASMLRAKVERLELESARDGRGYEVRK